MSESKHTPGPWAASLCDVEAGQGLNGNYRVADTFGPDAEANARLIAAAPEVMGALKWAMSQIPKYSRRISGQNESFCNAYDAAEAALAKAEGRS